MAQSRSERPGCDGVYPALRDSQEVAYPAKINSLETANLMKVRGR
ncbi:MAG: hypothetical protein R3C11_28830 [Planctomycetaceae bacterium]